MKVAWAKLIAASPFVLPDFSDLYPHKGHECPEERYEDKGRKSGKSRRMVKYKQRYSMNSFFFKVK